jgi:hypothetical protein
MLRLNVASEQISRKPGLENMILEAGHKLFVGNPVLIRKTALYRQKNDRIDAEHIDTVFRDTVLRYTDRKLSPTFLDARES